MPSGASRRPPAFRYGAAVGIVALACALREALTPLWGATAIPFIFFWPAVVLATGYGRLGPGVLALILSALAADWFFIEPRHALLPRTLTDLLALAVFIGAGSCLVLAVEGMHRSEGKLRESERKFAAMFRSLPIAAGIQELPEARFVDVNDAFVRMFGHSREEMLGKTSLEIGMVSDAEGRKRRMDQFLRDGYVRDLRARVTTKAGEILEALVNAELVELQGKKYVLSSARDVTRETRAREEI
ncbi:MAG TPA: DUF4118 domain-containing protein, partial [Planctomycetota bacterium]|nr:DUF4118 domain-containing protein [Planctomycetota bacterium]